jgi:hypothetical protein
MYYKSLFIVHRNDKKAATHARRSGMTTFRTVPSGDVSTTEISPPWDFTSSAAIASPSPVPP